MGAMNERQPLESVDALLAWLEPMAAARYGMERVSQLAHALQCATLAEREGAGDALVAAALLHDVGHLLQNDARDQPRVDHAIVGAGFLTAVFDAAVVEPIRLHAEAKRFLVTTDPLYFAGLSPASVRSLRWQGGAMDTHEAEAFLDTPHARDAVRLRRWDDAAKDPEMQTASLAHFRPLLAGLWRVQ